MKPSVSSSSVMTSRRIVVLPEPEGPMRVTRSPLSTEKFRPLSTVLSPYFLTTSSKRRAGAGEWGSAAGSVAGKALLQFSQEDRGGVARREEDETREDKGLDVGEGARAVVLRRINHLGNGDDKEEGRVLEHRDHPGAQRGHRGPQGLRHDDAVPGAPIRQGQRRRRFPLAGWYRLDARAVDLGHVGGVMDAQDGDADG